MDNIEPLDLNQSPLKSQSPTSQEPGDTQKEDANQPLDVNQEIDLNEPPKTNKSPGADQEDKANSVGSKNQNTSFDGKGPVGFAAAFQQIIHSVGPTPNRFPGPLAIPHPPGDDGFSDYPGSMPPSFRPMSQAPLMTTDNISITTNESQNNDDTRSVEENLLLQNRKSCEREDSSNFKIKEKKPGGLPSLLDIEVKLPPPVKNLDSGEGIDNKGTNDFTPSLRTSVTFGPQANNGSNLSSGPLNKPYGFEKRLPNTFSRPPRPPWAPHPSFIRPGYNPNAGGGFAMQGQRYSNPPNYPPMGQGYSKPLNALIYNEQTSTWEVSSNTGQGGHKRRSSESIGQENETPAKKMSIHKEQEMSVGEEKSPSERVRKVVTPLWNLPISVQLEKKEGAFYEFLGHLKHSLVSTNQALSSWFEHQESKNYNKLYVENKQILASPVTNGYRNKCDFVIGLDPETKKTTVGFLIEQGTSFVGPVGHLSHISEGMKYIAAELEKYCQTSEIPPFDLSSGSGNWMGATIRQSKFGEIMLNVAFHPQELNKLQLKSVKERLRDYFTSGPGQTCRISSLFFTTRKQWESGETENIYGMTSITEEICGRRFQISSRTFFAVNTPAAELMYNTISGMVHLNMSCTLVDICCGTGSIGLSLSDRCGQVLGIDILEEAVNDANKNALANNITNCEFMIGSVEDSLPNLWRRVAFNEAICIVDPPRAGIGSKAIQSMRKNSSVTKIVYIASDPYSAVKNFLDFARPPSNSFKGEPFVPVRAIPVDLFPHTSNFCIVFLFMRVKMADLLSPENIDVSSYLRGASDETNSQRVSIDSLNSNQTPNSSMFPEHSANGGPAPDLTWKKVQNASRNTISDQSQDSISTELSEEQIHWLDQMVQHYGSAFERDQWIESFKAQNAEARANYLATLGQSQSYPNNTPSTETHATENNFDQVGGDATKTTDTKDRASYDTDTDVAVQMFAPGAATGWGPAISD